MIHWVDNDRCRGLSIIRDPYIDIVAAPIVVDVVFAVGVVWRIIGFWSLNVVLVP